MIDSTLCAIMEHNREIPLSGRVEGCDWRTWKRVRACVRESLFRITCPVGSAPTLHPSQLNAFPPVTSVGTLPSQLKGFSHLTLSLCAAHKQQQLGPWNWRHREGPAAKHVKVVATHTTWPMVSKDGICAVTLSMTCASMGFLVALVHWIECFCMQPPEPHIAI